MRHLLIGVKFSKQRVEIEPNPRRCYSGAGWAQRIKVISLFFNRLHYFHSLFSTTLLSYTPIFPFFSAYLRYSSSLPALYEKCPLTDLQSCPGCGSPKVDSGSAARLVACRRASKLAPRAGPSLGAAVTLSRIMASARDSTRSWKCACVYKGVFFRGMY